MVFPTKKTRGSRNLREGTVHHPRRRLFLGEQIRQGNWSYRAQEQGKQGLQQEHDAYVSAIESANANLTDVGQSFG